MTASRTVRRPPMVRPRQLVRSPRAWLALAIALGTAAVASATLRPVLARLGHPGATLDDAYIHFQYARAYVEGHPLRFQAGEPRSSGGTSFAWPVLLAVFYGAGLQGESILWAAWGMSFLALAGVAWEAAALTRRLAAGEPGSQGGQANAEVAAFFAAALVIAFSPFAWFAASGMEVVPFAWVLARLARLAAEETDEATGAVDLAAGPRGRWLQITALSWLAPLLRPEGAALTALVALVVSADRRSPLPLRLRRAGVVAFGALLPTLLLLATTGQATSSTAQVKLLSGDPYLDGPGALLDAVVANLVMAVTSLLDGGPYSAEFLPAHGAWILCAGLVALALGVRRGTRNHTVLILGLAALLFVPCTYVTFLWNRLRYLWPFATGWIVGVACFAALLSGGLVRLIPRDLRWPWLSPLLTAGLLAPVVFLLEQHLPGVIDDVVDSASGIDRQQVSLGRWVKTSLPPDVRVGVNDTGAIAYFGDHKTFDVVGLTTPSEGRYWVAGHASRFEHYEKLLRESPASLPDVFTVYPQWFALPVLLGEPLATRQVQASILGGTVMTAFRADRAALGSGELPWSLPPGAVIFDTVDVADLESESAHGYARAGTTLADEVMGATTRDTGVRVVDGGRGRRTVERFVVRFPAAASGASGCEGCVGVLRYGSDSPFEVAIGDRTVSVPAAELDEVSYRLGGSAATTVELRFSHPIAVFHHWFARPAGPDTR